MTTIQPELLTFAGIALTAVISYFVNRWSNQTQIRELNQKQMELEQKLAMDKETHEADLSDHYLSIAKASGEQVISRDATIRELETVRKELRKEIQDLGSKVEGLLEDKNKLETENRLKDKRISVLEHENQNLRNRVEILEGQLKKHDKPIPPN